MINLFISVISDSSLIFNELLASLMKTDLLIEFGIFEIDLTISNIISDFLTGSSL